MDLDGPENTYIGDKFDNLVMVYLITKNNFWWYSLDDMIYNPGMFLCYMSRNYELVHEPVGLVGTILGE